MDEINNKLGRKLVQHPRCHLRYCFSIVYVCSANLYLSKTAHPACFSHSPIELKWSTRHKRRCILCHYTKGITIISIRYDDVIQETYRQISWRGLQIKNLTIITLPKTKVEIVDELWSTTTLKQQQNRSCNPSKHYIFEEQVPFLRLLKSVAFSRFDRNSRNRRSCQYLKTIFVWKASLMSPIKW